MVQLKQSGSSYDIAYTGISHMIFHVDISYTVCTFQLSQKKDFTNL